MCVKRPPLNNNSPEVNTVIILLHIYNQIFNNDVATLNVYIVQTFILGGD